MKTRNNFSRKKIKMNYENILTENKNNVLVITLNRPENYNAFDEKMRMELLDTLKSAERDKLVRAIVIRGAGEKHLALVRI